MVLKSLSITKGLVLLVMGISLLLLTGCDSSSDDHDLSVIGKGENVVVQVHDPK